MDLIRQALGADQINYYGFSYGTYLGQVYATLFPGRMRRAVFDANVDPRNVWYQANLNQDLAFDRNIRIWFGWLAEHHAVYRLGKTQAAVSKRFYAEEQRMEAEPAGGVVGPAEWDDAFLYVTYCECLWTYLADVFSSWVHHANVKSSSVPTDTPTVPVTTTASRSTTPSSAPTSSGRTTGQPGKRTTGRPTRKHRSSRGATPGTTRRVSSGTAPAGVPTTVVGDGTPVLLIGETLDAATPSRGTSTCGACSPTPSSSRSRVARPMPGRCSATRVSTTRSPSS